MNLLLKLKIALEPFRETLLFTILLTLLLLCIASRICRKMVSYPPRSKGLPLIGNMNIMEQLTHRGLAKQCSGVLHHRMGFLHMVAISNAEAAHQVLQVRDNCHQLLNLQHGCTTTTCFSLSPTMLLPLTIRPLCFSSSSWEIEIKNSNTPSLEEEEGILKKLKSNRTEEDHEEQRGGYSLYTSWVLLGLRG